jgi:hypothetical protein
MRQKKMDGRVHMKAHRYEMEPIHDTYCEVRS